MKWKKHDDNAIVSDCGCYSVTKIGAYYEAWRRRAHPDGPKMLDTHIETSADARKLCERDAAQ